MSDSLSTKYFHSSSSCESEDLKNFDQIESKDQSENNLCRVCEKPAKQKCSLCLTTYYCGKECQTFEWETHRFHCKGRIGKTVYGIVSDRKILIASYEKIYCENWFNNLSDELKKYYEIIELYLPKETEQFKHLTGVWVYFTEGNPYLYWQKDQAMKANKTLDVKMIHLY